MNHQGIEDADRLEAYVTGRMGPDESAELEEHLVDCPLCLARVEAVQGLLGGFHALAGELPAPVQPARSPWLRRAAVALAALAAVAVAVLWGTVRERRTAMYSTTLTPTDTQVLNANYELASFTPGK